MLVGQAVSTRPDALPTGSGRERSTNEQQSRAVVGRIVYRPAGGGWGEGGKGGVVGRSLAHG